MLVGQQIGPFEIELELGSGAMGTVYRAKFDRGGKVVPVALKVVALGLLGNEGAMARFEREANILKQLRHPHIVRLLATGHYRKTPFIAMEFIDGEALDRILARRSRLSWEEVTTYVKQLCTALQHAHEQGIIHRDLKPSNLMVTRDDILKLTDFGIAKDTDVTALTGANSTIGTAAYMSPEQCKGDKNLTNKSDLYSLGIVMFELLSGRKPFMADSTVDMFLKHVNERPPRVGKIVPDIPAKLEALILQLLEKSKEDRPPDAAWVGRLLEEIEGDAFARKSAGLDAASARKIDRPRATEERPIDDDDREAARALKGKRKRKKKPAEPWFERRWVKAGGILAALAGMAIGVYYAVKPPSAERLVAALDAAKEPRARYEAAEQYLRAHGDKPGEATDKAAAAFREWKVQERERQLVNRFGTKWKDDPEGDDATAYKDAIDAIQAEKTGRWGDAVTLWGRVKGRFPEEAKLPYTFDDQKLIKARWGWLGEKRLKDMEEAQAKVRELDAKIVDARRSAKPTSFDPSSPESLAIKALRLTKYSDTEKAGRFWDTLVSQTEKDPEHHVWFLLASQQRAALPKEPPESAVAKRAKLVEERWKAVEEEWKKARDTNADGDWRVVQIYSRELIELYDDETEKSITDVLARVREVLAEATKRG